EENIEQSKLIANIINNLIVFSRVDAHESLNFESLDLSMPLRSTIAKLTPFAERNEVVLDYTPTELPPIKGNETAIEQAFYNLIKNAIIYRKIGGGVVTITSKALEHEIVISISDNGIGIQESDLQHIFEPFY